MNVSQPDVLRQALLSEHNILIRPLGDVVYLMLPLIVDESLIHDTIQRIADCLVRK